MAKVESFSVKDEDNDMFEKFKELRWREKKSTSELFMEAVKEYMTKHADGNFQYTLDDPVLATPAMFRDYHIWSKYYMNLKAGEEDDFKFKIQELKGLHKKRFGYEP